LKANKIQYTFQYRSPLCRDKKPLPFDFAVFDIDGELISLIEVDGQQHFTPVFGDKSFDSTVRHDKMKNKYCNNQNINLIRIPYWEFNDMQNLNNTLIQKIYQSCAKPQ
jgi:hypothetical protein